jgi:hypothetical protein
VSGASARAALAAGCCAAIVAGCVSAPPQQARGYLEYRTREAPVAVAARIATGVRDCWFGERRGAFASLVFAPELDSYSGRPRVLIVPADNPGGLPRLVIEASRDGEATSVKLFGPLLAAAEGGRIARDVERWTKGATACA